MSDVFQLNPVAAETTDKYRRIGLPRNPFLPQDVDGKIGPFYQGHLTSAIQEFTQWLVAALDGFVSPISVKGSIGVGKTRVLLQVQFQINQLPQERKVYAGYARIDKTGYSRPSVGQMLLEALEEVRISPEMETAPEGVMPALWAAVTTENRMGNPNSKMGAVISRLQTIQGPEKVERTKLVCRWLHRDVLSASQSERVGLHGRVDYEGQLPEVLADLIRCFRELDVLRQIFFMVDQLEDVFRPSYSDLRRSRILTDLRSLIDEIDKQCPIALALAWSPEVDDPRSYVGRTDVQLNREYPALYSRLIRQMIELDKLDQFNATGFADEYLTHVSKLTGYDPQVAPKALDLASEAWRRLEREKKAVDNRATPRDLLAALRAVVDERANAASLADEAK
jgi:hypothetical protein